MARIRPLPLVNNHETSRCNICYYELQLWPWDLRNARKNDDASSNIIQTISRKQLEIVLIFNFMHFLMIMLKHCDKITSHNVTKYQLKVNKIWYVKFSMFYVKHKIWNKFTLTRLHYSLATSTNLQYIPSLPLIRAGGEKGHIDSDCTAPQQQ